MKIFFKGMRTVGYAVLLILLTSSSCNVIPDRTFDILDKGIDELARQPDRWKETMNVLIQQLEQSGTALSKQVATDVQSTVNSISAQIGNQVSCRSDFVAVRLQQRLQALGNRLNPSRFSAPNLYPVVCSTEPSNFITPQTNQVTFSGFDFQEFNQINPFQAYLQYADGTLIQSAGFVAITTNYQLAVDLQSPMLKQAIQGMDKNRGPQIVLKWGENNVQDASSQSLKNQAALIIQLPDPPPPSRPYQVVATIAGSGGPFGDWAPNAEQCPTGQWMRGAALTIEQSLGGRKDDTALNGIHLLCGTVSDRGRIHEIRSRTGPWGTRRADRFCANGYVVGARLRIEPPQRSGDDTGGVDAEFRCENGDILSSDYKLGWGNWSSWKTCPPASAICGIKTKVEGNQGSGDDTALNDAEFTCCSLP